MFGDFCSRFFLLPLQDLMVIYEETVFVDELFVTLTGQVCQRKLCFIISCYKLVN